MLSMNITLKYIKTKNAYNFNSFNTNIIFTIKNFSYNKYFMKMSILEESSIFSTEQFSNYIEKSSFVLYDKKELVEKIMEIAKNFDFSLLEKSFNNNTSSISKQIVRISYIKDVHQRNKKIQNFIYCFFNEFEQRIAVNKIQKILLEPMYNPEYTLCKNIMKRYFEQ
jgi:hypothetical protein